MAFPITKAKALREWKLYYFVLPSLALVLTFAYFPTISAVYHSFFEWDGGSGKEYVGFGNYSKVIGDETFWGSFMLILILIIANLFKLIPSIFTAVMIHRIKSDRAQYWYRVGVVIPMIVPGIVVLFIWKFFFDPSYGLLNKVLDVTGIKSLLVGIDGLFGWNIFLADAPISWLSTPELIAPALVIWGFPWIGTVGVLIYLAGLQNISKELYESSELDGANPFQQFLYIEFPLIMTQVRLSLVLMIIGTLQGFGQQFLLLGINGGPAGAGMTPGLWMFNKAFNQGQFGYACALGMFLFVFILALTYINNKYVRVDK